MPRPRRVAYFVANYHRFAGAQRSLSLLVGGLDRRRVDPLVICAGDGYATRMYRDLGFDVAVVEAHGETAGFGGGLLRAGLLRRAAVALREVAPYTLRLRRVLRDEGADVLHANDARGVLLAGPAARLLGLPVVWHVRGDARSLGGIYQAACGALAHRIILVADGVRASLTPRLWPRCVTVHNGIADDARPPRRGRAELLAGLSPPLALDPADPLVVAVGSVVPMKGVHHLVDAAARQPRRVGFVLVGDAPDERYGDWLARRVRDHGLADVRFAGWDHDATDWIRAADVVCLPTVDEETLSYDGTTRTFTNTEGFSRTVLEAMLFARPVVASAVVGIPEQVEHGTTGLLVPPSDPVALAEAIARVAADPPLRERMGAAGARRVRERFTIEQMVAGTMRVYDELPAAGSWSSAAKRGIWGP